MRIRHPLVRKSSVKRKDRSPVSRRNAVRGRLYCVWERHPRTDWGYALRGADCRLGKSGRATAKPHTRAVGNVEFH